MEGEARKAKQLYVVTCPEWTSHPMRLETAERISARLAEDAAAKKGICPGPHDVVPYDPEEP